MKTTNIVRIAATAPAAVTMTTTAYTPAFAGGAHAKKTGIRDLFKTNTKRETKQEAQADTVVKTFSDENATAYIFADGSGYIELAHAADGMKLTAIGGKKLSEIIRFKNNGFVHSVSYTENDAGGKVRFYGAGPAGWLNGTGYVRFTDEAGNTHETAMFQSMPKMYTDKTARITRISWTA